MKQGSIAKLVMPGLVPGIHVLAGCRQERRGYRGTGPAMTKILRRLRTTAAVNVAHNAIDSGRDVRCIRPMGVVRSSHEATCPSIASRFSRGRPHVILYIDISG